MPLHVLQLQPAGCKYCLLFEPSTVDIVPELKLALRYKTSLISSSAIGRSGVVVDALLTPGAAGAASG
eukprot:6012203-Amphidinium_carterae.1